MVSREPDEPIPIIKCSSILDLTYFLSKRNHLLKKINKKTVNFTALKKNLNFINIKIKTHSPSHII